jgi:hypothetical protein
MLTSSCRSTRDQFPPAAEARDLFGQGDRELVAAGLGRLAHHRPERRPGALRGGDRAFGRGLHLFRPVEHLVERRADERGRHQAEVRERRVPPADVVGVDEHRPEAALARQRLERRPGRDA